MNNTLEFLKAIADDNRFKIITFLKDGEKCVCEIWKELNLPQNLISHHLKVLKDNKILFDRRDGQKIYYKLNNKEIAKQIKGFNKITQETNEN
jgi:DNA-binding transcriptional ArsR family regulator